MSKIFWVLNLQTGAIDHMFESATPRAAALKAANKKITSICLVEANAGKVHLFEGSQVPLEPHETTPYTERRNITHKACARKMFYKKVTNHFLIDDMEELSRMLREELQ